MILQGLLTFFAAAGFTWILWRDRPQWMRRTSAAGLLVLVCVSLAFAVVERFEAARQIDDFSAAVKLAGPWPTDAHYADAHRDVFGYPVSADWKEFHE